MNYTGEKCVLCGGSFAEDDDIVVCPECGSPHHRKCYQKLGVCANSAIHASGEKWQRANFHEEKPEKPQEEKICPVCSYPNDPAAENCTRCGAALDKEDGSARQENMHGGAGFGPMRPYLGFDPEEDMGGATLREVFHFVGSNTIYYIPIFKRMKDFGTKLSFNIFCLFFPPLYFANRRMWGWAIIAAFVTIILNIPTFILSIPNSFGETAEFERIIDLISAHKSLLNELNTYADIISMVVSVLFGLFSNYLYYMFTLKSLRRLRAGGKGQVNAETALMAGGIRPLNIVLIILIMFGIAFTIFYMGMSMLDVSVIMRFIK